MNVKFQASVALSPRMNTLYILKGNLTQNMVGEKPLCSRLTLNIICPVGTQRVLSYCLCLKTFRKKLLFLSSLLLKMCSQALCSYGYKEVSLINGW
jgi:hypothetical protein